MQCGRSAVRFAIGQPARNGFPCKTGPLEPGARLAVKSLGFDRTPEEPAASAILENTRQSDQALAEDLSQKRECRGSLSLAFPSVNEKPDVYPSCIRFKRHSIRCLTLLTEPYVVVGLTCRDSSGMVFPLRKEKNSAPSVGGTATHRGGKSTPVQSASAFVLEGSPSQGRLGGCRSCGRSKSTATGSLRGIFLSKAPTRPGVTRTTRRAK